MHTRMQTDIPVAHASICMLCQRQQPSTCPTRHSSAPMLPEPSHTCQLIAFRAPRCEQTTIPPLDEIMRRQ